MKIKNAIDNYLNKQKQTNISLKAVLFDMDGILFDTMPFHAQSWQETATKHHLKSELSDFYLFEGCTGFFTINELFQRTFNREATPEEIEQIYVEKSDRFGELNDGVPMTGAEEVVRKAADSGLQTLVVTGSGQYSLFDKLEKCYPGYFKRDKMVTAYDVENGKPDPEPYQRGLQKAQVQPHQAIVIENAPMGVRSGVAAGIFTIAVNTGPLPDEILLQEGADLLYTDMSALAADWEKLMKHLL